MKQEKLLQSVKMKGETKGLHNKTKKIRKMRRLHQKIRVHRNLKKGSVRNLDKKIQIKMPHFKDHKIPVFWNINVLKSNQ